MLASHQKIAGSLQRSVHALNASSLIPTATRLGPAQRHFHPTPAAYLPRRRSFFTSNVLLNPDGSDDSPSGRTLPTAVDDGGSSSKSREAAADAPQRQSSASRRKPPLKNSLRRVAVVAQKGVPSRSVPPQAEAPEDGSSTVTAVCVAESFDMDAVAGALQVHGFQLDPDASRFEVHEVVHARGVNSGDIFVFPSGTVVAWSLPPDVLMKLATRYLLPAAEDPHVDRKEVEDLEYVVDPERDQSAVNGDVLVLGTRQEAQDGDRLNTTMAKIAFSSGLARSTKLAVLETSLNSYFESTRSIPALLSRGSGFALSRRFILQKTGELLSLRAQLNHYNELTDSLPDIFWDSRSELRLETYYDRVGKALDVGVRIKTLNEKMNYAQEVVDVLRETSSERHSARLEWIIIVLIALEILFELRRLYMERQETAANSSGGAAADAAASEPNAEAR